MRERSDEQRDVVPLENEDAAFVLGKGGSTKQKICAVSGADLKLTLVDNENTIEIFGTRKQRRAAKDYIALIVQQRSGSVIVDLNEPPEDMTGLAVPSECVPFVMGRFGATLRMLESEWGTLMFFTKAGERRRDDPSSTEMLVIFGPIHARRGAELKVMSQCEYKKPGTFTSGNGTDQELMMQKRLLGDKSPKGWDVDWIPLKVEEFSYALGTKGATRKKLALASGCIVEYIGQIACLCGAKKERKRARDYLRWLLQQRVGTVKVDADSREDVNVLSIPSDSIGFISGHRGESLRNIELSTQTFCFVNDSSKTQTSRGPDASEKVDVAVEDLLIFSHNEEARKNARRKIKEQIEIHKNIGGRAAMHGKEDVHREWKGYGHGPVGIVGDNARARPLAAASTGRPSPAAIAAAHGKGPASSPTSNARGERRHDAYGERRDAFDGRRDMHGGDRREAYDDRRDDRHDREERPREPAAAAPREQARERDVGVRDRELPRGLGSPAGTHDSLQAARLLCYQRDVRGRGRNLDRHDQGRDRERDERRGGGDKHEWRQDAAPRVNTNGGVRDPRANACFKCGQTGHWANACPDPR